MTLVIKSTGTMRPLEPHEFEMMLALLQAEMLDGPNVAKIFRDNPEFTDWVAAQ